MSEEKTIQSMSQEHRKINPPKEFTEKAYVKSEEEYKKIYKESIEDPEGFWASVAENLDWDKKCIGSNHGILFLHGIRIKQSLPGLRAERQMFPIIVLIDI